MKRFKRLSLALFGAVLVAATAWAISPDLPSTGEYLGPVNYVVADEGGTAVFETGEDIARYLVIGFETAPMVLEVSDPLNPLVVSGYTDLSTGADNGVDFYYTGSAVFVAGSENGLQQIDSIESL